MEEISRENNFNLRPILPKEERVEPPRKKGSALTFANLLLAMIVIGLGVYIFITEKNMKDSKVEKDNGKTKEEVVITKYTGKYISADLPTDWEITEYGNGQGTVSLTDGPTYTGLTGLKVRYNNEEILSMPAIDGIGSNSCPKLPHFSDSSDIYEKDIKEMVEGTGETFELLDYTNGEYTKYKWLDRDIRRVGRTLYYDTKNNNQYFEPQCMATFVAFETSLFENDSGSPTMNGYMYKINESATEELLQQLDKILESMKVI